MIQYRDFNIDDNNLWYIAKRIANKSMQSKKNILIKAPEGVLEVDALWQNGNPLDESTDTVALLCHPNPLHGGAMTNKVVTTMYRFARDTGFHVVRFNFRGVGASSGEHDYAKGEVIDAISVLQWIQEQTNARKLWLGGFSFGGYVTARVAETLMLSAHIWGLEDFDLQKVALIAPSVVNNDTSDLSLPTLKTFVIYGNDDEVVDPDAIAAFASTMEVCVDVMPKVGHFFHGKLGELKQLIEQRTFV